MLLTKFPLKGLNVVDFELELNAETHLLVVGILALVFLL